MNALTTASKSSGLAKGNPRTKTAPRSKAVLDNSPATPLAHSQPSGREHSGALITNGNGFPPYSCCPGMLERFITSKTIALGFLVRLHLLDLFPWTLNDHDRFPHAPSFKYHLITLFQCSHSLVLRFKCHLIPVSL